jgi:SSS family solute:Na+ symporter
MLVSYLPGWLSALLLAAFLAAILSTFAMISLAIATIFSHDIYRTLYRPEASEKEMTRVQRVVIIIVAGIAIGVATSLPPILAAMNWLFAWLVPVFWVLVFGLFWRCNQATAISTLLLSWAANSAWSFTSLPVWMGLADTPNAFVTVVISLSVLVVGNLVVPGSPGYLKRPVTTATMAEPG